MKVPVSKQLINYLLLPCLAVAGVGLLNLLTKGHKQAGENAVFLAVFGIPAIYFAFLLLNKNTKFRNNSKVRQRERLFRFSFSSSTMFPIFILSSLLWVAGLAVIVGDKNITGGWPMCLAGLGLFIIAAVCIEHPRIWFSDTFNATDLIEEQKKESSSPSFPCSDGVFSYPDADRFTVRLKQETRTIKWKDIVLIKAYKLDQYTIDCIVIDIHLKETAISIDDQTEGHMKFMETASKKLYPFKKDWFTTVAFPAFAKNLITIYKK